MHRHLRDIMVSRDAVTLQLLETGESIRAKYLEQARRCEPEFLYKALDILNQCEIYYKSSQKSAAACGNCTHPAMQPYQ